jgi:carboxypeptidase Taq
LTTALDDLRSRLAQVQDLRAVTMGLAWDQQVIMPPRGAAGRAEALATVESLAHERFCDAETGRLIEAAAAEVAGSPEDSFAASIVRVGRRDWEKACRVPAELMAEIARSAAIGYEAWTQARARSDWPAFQPYLERMLELKRRYVECFDGFACAYDALLDDYEQGMTTAEVARVFEELKRDLVPLIAAIASRGDLVDGSPLRGEFPLPPQHALARRVVDRLGFDPEAWRLDTAVHPFATNMGLGDVRITTRYDPTDFVTSLFSAIHETGHGLYEAGSDAELERTPLAGGVSLGLHESQSRMWENVVGRSRAFSAWLLPIVQEAFPDQMGRVDVEAYYRAVNEVAPSLIRVEADEATYSLHIILRFELEQDMVEGRIKLADLPEAWNAKMREYLGIDVPSHAEGVLQDVHWSEGAIGYFPTYALGNVMAAQIWDAARRDLPGVESGFERGEFTSLRDWLTERLYRHGRKFTPAQTLARVAGGPLDARPYLRYLREKLGAIYDLDGAATGAPSEP